MMMEGDLDRKEMSRLIGEQIEVELAQNQLFTDQDGALYYFGIVDLNVIPNKNDASVFGENRVVVSVDSNCLFGSIGYFNYIYYVPNIGIYFYVAKGEKDVSSD